MHMNTLPLRAFREEDARGQQGNIAASVFLEGGWLNPDLAERGGDLAIAVAADTAGAAAAPRGERCVSVACPAWFPMPEQAAEIHLLEW